VAATDGEYPFEFEQGLLRVKDGGESMPYIFMLLLCNVAPTAGHAGTAVMFEHLCVEAATNYLGGRRQSNARAIRFGSPRKAPLGKLKQIIDHACSQMYEGGGCKSPELAGHVGDDGLDVLAWKGFPDRKIGKLVAFGQCAAGSITWTAKLNELDGRKFSQKWFRDPLVCDPIRLFFVPRRVPAQDWRHAAIDAGIIFDRCRIAATLKDLDANLRSDCQKKIARLMKQAA
jgi:hypothetical protein